MTKPNTNPAEWLLENGWRECPDQFRPNDRCFYRSFDTPTRCHGNDDKPGIQVCIFVSNIRGTESMELELCAGLKDETWLKVLNYGLPADIESVVALIPRLLAIWESANSATVTSQGENSP